jgi:hypothetical protein
MKEDEHVGNSVAACEALTGDLAAFLDEVKATHALAARGRLIFGLDATASRNRTWDMATTLTAGMFREASAVGSLDLQLVYYRGDRECRASGWVSDTDRLVKIMTKIACEPGETQIERILAHAIKETAKLQVNALVFIRDAIEESLDILAARARELGRLGAPVFMFQEGNDPGVSERFRTLRRTRAALTRSSTQGPQSNWANCLRAVARFATGGIAALEGRKDAGSTLLLGQMNKRGRW